LRVYASPCDNSKQPKPLKYLYGYPSKFFMEIPNMVTLSDDEVALIRSILIALRSIKVRDIDRALVILSKGDKGEKP
jgi:hypothetical protein